MSKYGNKRTNGYASKREAKRAAELEALQAAGVISALRMQVPIEILPKQDGERAVYWKADFVYNDAKSGEEIWEDVKGIRTPLYILKRKLVLYQYGKKILET